MKRPDLVQDNTPPFDNDVRTHSITKSPPGGEMLIEAALSARDETMIESDAPSVTRVEREVNENKAEISVAEETVEPPSLDTPSPEVKAWQPGVVIAHLSALKPFSGRGKKVRSTKLITAIE